MDEKYKNQSIDRLDVKDNVINTLKANNIKTIGQLCKKSRTDLSKLDLLHNEISKIDIELQLLGLNLRGSL